MKRHAILEKDGIRIGVTGATAAFTTFYSLLGWDALDPETALREQCLLLAPQVDILIILSHLGLPADQKRRNSYQPLIQMRHPKLPLH